MKYLKKFTKKIQGGKLELVVDEDHSFFFVRDMDPRTKGRIRDLPAATGLGWVSGSLILIEKAKKFLEARK